MRASAFANNLILASTRGPLALLLNPDTEALQGTLDRCVREHARASAGGDGRLPPGRSPMAPSTMPPSVPSRHHWGRSRISRKIGRVLQGGALAQYRATEVPEHGQGEVDAVNGAFMLVRRSAIEQVGLLDEAYWLYMEDLDWCYRFHQAGWQVWYEGSSSFVHVKGGTSKRRGHRSLRTNVAFHRGMGRFYRKFYAGRRPLLDSAVYLAIGAKLAVSATRGALATRVVAG